MTKVKKGENYKRWNETRGLAIKTRIMKKVVVVQTEGLKQPSLTSHFLEKFSIYTILELSFTTQL